VDQPGRKDGPPERYQPGGEKSVQVFDPFVEGDILITVATAAAPNGKLYFAADDGTHGVELWETDATPTGTKLVKDIVLGLKGIVPVECSGLWKCALFQRRRRPARPRAMAVAAGLNYWRFLMCAFRNFCIEPMESRLMLNASLVAMRISIRKAARSTRWKRRNDGDLRRGRYVNGLELYRSDGTKHGTYLLKDIYAGPKGSGPQFLATINDTLFFSAYDGTNWALWRPTARPMEQ